MSKCAIPASSSRLRGRAAIAGSSNLRHTKGARGVLRYSAYRTESFRGQLVGGEFCPKPGFQNPHRCETALTHTVALIDTSARSRTQNMRFHRMYTRSTRTYTLKCMTRHRPYLRYLCETPAPAPVRRTASSRLTAYERWLSCEHTTTPKLPLL